eukprot:CAMPEP_0172698072 /NCGR_PEP_ID=MMETSP1074-20121228/29202_1 /TAXON_ID=2916 /ORGANISM="Ceratium fusus, Strain PA161109" /LENGTH=182 /DNA_ID=CAMNT_0013519059 /DNA_START=226 /DNA_END=775 /DNA_ORIENTATION=+
MEAAGQIPMWLCRHQLNGDHVILRRCVWAGGGGGVGGGGGGVGYVQHAADHSRRGLLAAHTCVSLQKAVFFVFFVGCVFIEDHPLQSASSLHATQHAKASATFFNVFRSELSAEMQSVSDMNVPLQVSGSGGPVVVVVTVAVEVVPLVEPHPCKVRAAKNTAAIVARVFCMAAKARLSNLHK